MKEKDVQKAVTDMLDATGWQWWHVPAPMVAGKDGWRPYRKAAGLPDIFAFYDDPPRMLILELKGDSGKLFVAVPPSSKCSVTFAVPGRSETFAIRM